MGWYMWYIYLWLPRVTSKGELPDWLSHFHQNTYYVRYIECHMTIVYFSEHKNMYIPARGSGLREGEGEGEGEER